MVSGLLFGGHGRQNGQWAVYVLRPDSNVKRPTHVSNMSRSLRQYSRLGQGGGVLLPMSSIKKYGFGRAAM